MKTFMFLFFAFLFYLLVKRLFRLFLYVRQVKKNVKNQGRNVEDADFEVLDDDE